MPQLLHLYWQDIIVWFVLGLVIFVLLYYIGRRWQSLKNVTHKSSGKNLENCASCQDCPHSVQTCAKADNQIKSED